MVTVLPDKPLLKEQKSIKNAKIEKFKCDILGDFQTLCSSPLLELTRGGHQTILYFYVITQ